MKILNGFKNRILITRSFLLIVVLALVILKPLYADEHSRDDHERSIVGSWLTTYTFPSFTIPVLLSFTADGIVIETDYPGPETSDAQAGSIFSNGHGEWEVSRGGSFTCLYRKIIYRNDSSQFGLTKSKLTLTLSSDGSHLNGSGLIEFADLQGKVVFSATVAVSGTRIKVD